MAVYLVEDSRGNKRVIETRTKAGAVNFVAKSEYTATTLNTGDLVKYIREGKEIETADEADSTPEQQEA